jgi:hypothetical protein
MGRIHQLGVAVGGRGGIEKITKSVKMKVTGTKVSEAKLSDRERELNGGDYRRLLPDLNHH